MIQQAPDQKRGINVPTHHQIEIMQWLRDTQLISLSKTPTTLTYQRYAQTFKDPISHTVFSRFLTSQGITRMSMRYQGKTVKTYNAARNSRLEYKPLREKIPCVYCEGKGYVTIELDDDEEETTATTIVTTEM